MNGTYAREAADQNGRSKIFSSLAEIASRKDCGRIDWFCMEINLTEKEYYHKMGAEEIEWFKVFRLNRGQIESLREKT